MKKEGLRVIISTVYSGRAIKVAINKLSPDKLILIVDESKDKTKEETVKELNKVFKDIIEIEILKTSLYDIPEIISKVIKKIDEESKKGNEILIHITEGRKITSLALLFSGYMKKDKIKGAYYIIEETNQVLPLPLISFDLGESKKKLLRELSKGNGVVHDLEKKLNLKQSAIYQHVQELKQGGYIENGKELRLTNLGRMMIL